MTGFPAAAAVSGRRVLTEKVCEMKSFQDGAYAMAALSASAVGLSGPW